MIYALFGWECISIIVLFYFIYTRSTYKSFDLGPIICNFGNSVRIKHPQRREWCLILYIQESNSGAFRSFNDGIYILKIRSLRFDLENLKYLEYTYCNFSISFTKWSREVKINNLMVNIWAVYKFNDVEISKSDEILIEDYKTILIFLI